jgi:eukaryotic-like serine/threonine-protein kinase
LAFGKAAWNWLQKRKIQQRQQAIDALSQMTVQQAKATAEAELATYALSPESKKALVTYLSAVPMTTRRAISRPNDGGTPTTLLSQLPQSPVDLQRFFPLRPPRFQPGDQVPGHDYRLECLLGQGGFAEVWKAQHILRAGQPPVALKFCLNQELLVSLKNEIQLLDILGQHQHPEDFVRLYETAYSADPPFLVYEYIDGGDLASWVASFDGNRPSYRDVVRVLKMTARALAFAHEHGVVHRDLKPANLLVTRAGRIKIADFGIGAIMAAAEGQSASRQSSTGASLLQGALTPLYADPLQPLGEPPNPRVDVYALGVIAYQLLTGDVTRRIGPAWRADLQQSHIPTALLDIMAACVDISSRRLADAGALLVALETMEPSKKRVTANDPAAGEHPPGKARSTGGQVVVNYCIKCGVKVQPDDRFCTKCGYHLR